MFATLSTILSPHNVTYTIEPVEHFIIGDNSTLIFWILIYVYCRLLLFN